MKKLQLGRWLLLFLLALQFTACDNEPLEGEFPEPPQSSADPGQFVAVVNGQGFVAESVSATIDTNNNLIISGAKVSSGEVITIIVENASVGVIDLTTGSGTLNAGIYIGTDNPTNAYSTNSALGGSGTLEITQINTDSLTVSGTFAMNVVRQAVDSEGNPVEDGDGNPVIENASITNGAFTDIPYMQDDTGGGGGGTGGPVDPFFAFVNGGGFTAVDVDNQRVEIGGIPMIQIRATDSFGRLIRIDIPEDLGVGTFDMEQLSDGTKLIGIYNPNTGGEDLSSNPGTITITEFNTLVGRIVAEFAFTASDPLGQDPTVAEITEGSFDIRYPAVPTEPENTMIVDVEGVGWAADFVDAVEFDLDGTATVTARGYNSVSGELIEITFPKNLAPGSYDFITEQVAGESVAVFIPVIGETAYTSTDGSIVVLSNELETGGAIEAGFLFLAEDLSGETTDNFSLTNGLFNLSL